MRPRDTRYRLARTPRDYHRCHALLPDAAAQLAFPTVMAERDHAVVGFLSTDVRHGQIVAGPLIVQAEQAHPGLLVLRLVEAYEQVLRSAGVRGYVFHVEAANTAWTRILTKLSLEPYHDAPQGLWYRRQLA